MKATQAQKDALLKRQQALEADKANKISALEQELAVLKK